MVPVGEQAIYWIEKYLTYARPRLCLDTRTQALFLTGYGGPFNPDVVVALRLEMDGPGGPRPAVATRCATPAPPTCSMAAPTSGYIQQLLGHESLETTAIYTEVSIRQLQDVHARCHPVGRLRPPWKRR